MTEVIIHKIEKATDISSAVISGAVFVPKVSELFNTKNKPGNMVVLSGRFVCRRHLQPGHYCPVKFYFECFDFFLERGAYQHGNFCIRAESTFQ